MSLYFLEMLLVATEGIMKGLHSGMGIAAKAMVLNFVVFTISMSNLQTVYSRR